MLEISDISADELEGNDDEGVDLITLATDGTVYHILNTNTKNSETDQETMLDEKIGSAYYDPWKFHIDKIKKNDIVFLYQSGKGIIAFGEGTGVVNVRDYCGDKDEEHYMPLTDFHQLDTPISAFEMKTIASRNFNFMRTMFKIDAQSGLLIMNVCKERQI